MKSIDLSNQRFGKLLVVKRAYYHNKKLYWECLCDCGKTTFVTTSNLKCNKIKSCGCLKVNNLIERNLKHNQRNTKLYEVWKVMKQRCYNQNNKYYHNYGGRGITICDDWKNDYASFYNWSINNGYKEGLSIDRIDNDGNYEPSNCRWTTFLVQQNNKRSNTLLTFNNETKSIADWSRHFNTSYDTIHKIYKKYKGDCEKILKELTLNNETSK